MIPPFRHDGWLPAGHHPAEWDEIIDKFDGPIGSRRSIVLASLLIWRDAARDAGLHGRLIIDGSFLSSKPDPGDFDVFLMYDDATKLRLALDAEARALTDLQACHRRGFIGDVFAFSWSLVEVSPLLGHMDMFDLTGR